MNLIRIQQEDLNPYSIGDLLAFDDSITHPQGVVDLAMTVGEGSGQRKVVLNSMIVSCRSTSRGILGRFFLARLDSVTSLVHLKVTYHNAEGRLIMVIVDVDEAKRFKEVS